MKQIEISLTPEEYHDERQRLRAAARVLGVEEEAIGHAVVAHRSLDLRGGARYHTTMQVWLQGESEAQGPTVAPYRDCRGGEPIVIVGSGPAGMFAALRLLQLGWRPIVIERGREVDRRRRDIAAMAREGRINSESNWCYGEGGAGTFSDGKLYTRSTKRGNVQEVTAMLVQHGADAEIAIDAHAHIGTDRLGEIVERIRRTIEGHGGEYHFESAMSDLMVKDGRVNGVVCSDGTRYEGRAVILACGHSARDVYELFARRGWQIEAKPFALGVRVEHPQTLIDSIQYHRKVRPALLPPATYSLTAQVGGHGVFSFCMCPGGVIVPAATAEGEQVVNGMSNSKRNSPYANSGIAVTVGVEDAARYGAQGPLALLRLQQEVEQRMSQAVGGGLAAPAQRLTDFCQGRCTGQLNKSNYLCRCVEAPLYELLPDFVAKGLQEAFRLFDRKMRGFFTSEASVLGVESRTSSPVRIPRGDDLQHPQLKGLYPCGEGAGYAGGIVSSAMDGMKAAEAIATRR